MLVIFFTILLVISLCIIHLTIIQNPHKVILFYYFQLGINLLDDSSQHIFRKNSRSYAKRINADVADTIFEIIPHVMPYMS